MTSKNLFFNMMKEDFKGKLAVLLLNCFVMLICFPVCIGMQIDQLKREMKLGYWTQKEVVKQLKDWVSPENSMVMLVVIGFAMVMAFSQFAYLYQKSQVDFYHSLPIQRGKHFLARLLTGILLFLVPFIVFDMIGVGIISASGYGSIEIVKTAILGIVTNTIGFLLCYMISVLAVCMTGNLFSGIAGSLVFHCYGLALGYILEAMMIRYSSTYISKGNSFEDSAEYLTPIWVYSNLAGREEFGKWFLYAVILILGITVLSYLAFCKRKSESAGKSLAFFQTKPIIKVALMVLIVCNGTMLFYSFGVSVVWQVIGFVLCIVISQMLIQVIYELDVKAIVKGLPSFIAATVITLAVFGGFYVGGKAYDKGEMNWEKIESVAIFTGEAYGNYTRTNVYDPEEENYKQVEDLLYEQMKVTDLSLVKEFISATGKDQGKNQEVMIQFTLKNGKKQYRKFDVSNELMSEYMPKFMDNKEFRQGVNQVFYVDASYVDSIIYQSDIEDGYTSEITLNLTKENIQNLISSYKEEYLNASLSEINEEAPIYFLDLVNKEEDETLGTMIVYPSFEKTMEILVQAGLSKNPYENCEITKIGVEQYNFEYDEDGNIKWMEGSKYVTYTEKEKLDELMGILAFGDAGYYTYFHGDYEMRNRYFVVVEMKDDRGVEIEKRGIFIEQVPDWLVKDLENATEIAE